MTTADQRRAAWRQAAAVLWGRKTPPLPADVPPRRSAAEVKAILDRCFRGDVTVEVKENAPLVPGVEAVPWLAVTLRQGATSVTYVMEPDEPPYYVAERLAGMWGRKRLLEPTLLDELENLVP